MTMLDHLMVGTVKFMAFAGGLLAGAVVVMRVLM
jgi:hypothetical protein